MILEDDFYDSRRGGLAGNKVIRMGFSYIMNSYNRLVTLRDPILSP